MDKPFILGAKEPFLFAAFCFGSAESIALAGVYYQALDLVSDVSIRASSLTNVDISAGRASGRAAIQR